MTSPYEKEQILKKAFKIAYKEALKAYQEDEVPVGSCIIMGQKIIGAAHNQVMSKRNSIAHAEMRSISIAIRSLKTGRLNDSILVSTLEPCLLCSGAILMSRIKEVHFLAYEEKIPSLRQALSLKGNNHQVDWQKHEIDEFPAADLLRSFFKSKR